MNEIPQLNYDELRWADVSVPDIDAAKSFYSELFGWHYWDREFEGRVVYSLAFRKSDEQMQEPVAGIALHWGGKSENNVDAWHPHMLVKDADATVNRMLEAGGALTMPQMDVFDAGRMAICSDSLGNSMVAWQPFKNYGTNLMREPETLAWFELITDNPGQATEFYQNVFGWSAQRVPKEGVEYWMFSLNDRPTAGMQTDDSPTEGEHHWLVYFCVADLKVALEKCSQSGGRTAFDPVTEPSIGEFAVAVDNQNQRFGLVQFCS